MDVKGQGRALALSFSFLLAACGGGGDGDGSSPATPNPVTAEGAYAGTIGGSAGFETRTIILENGQFWTIYGETYNSVFYLYGLVQGNGQSINGSYTSTDLRDFFYDGQVYNYTMSASYVPGTSINGMVSDGTQSAPFVSQTLGNASYNYNQAPNLGNITGQWSMIDMQDASFTLTIAGNGSFSGSSGGCAFTGTLAPRASGKNVWNVSLTFGASPCLLPNQTASGIALDYLLASGQRQLLVAGVDATRSHGAVIAGVR